MRDGAAPQPGKDPAWVSLAANPGPVYRNAAAELVRLTEINIDSTAQTIGGWHGTSLEAMERALRLGALAPSSVAHGKAAPGHLFFYPAQAEDFDPHLVLEAQLHGRGGAIQYAHGSAAYHYLIKECGLDFADSKHHLLVMETIDCIESDPRAKYTRDALTELGISSKRQMELVRSVTERKGFLIAISREALEKWRPTDGDQPGIDEKIFVPAGLPFRFISAIQPLGPVERAYVERLRGMIAHERDLS